MWLFKPKEVRAKEGLVKKAVNVVFDNAPKGSVVSIYSISKLLTRDAVKSSALALVAVVDDRFPSSAETKIDAIFASHPELSEDRFCRFGVIYLSDFEGITAGRSHLCKDLTDVQLFVKYFRKGKYSKVYGRKIDFSDFEVDSLPDKEELRLLIAQTNFILDSFSNNGYIEQEPYRTAFGLSRLVIELTKLEMLITGVFHYEPDYFELEEAIEKERVDLFHIAMDIRRKNSHISPKGMSKYVRLVRHYLKYIVDKYLEK